MAIGYGVAVTTLQLAQAYAVLAADGVKRPVSLLRVEHAPEGERVLSELVAEQVKAMLAKVTQRGGTGRRARVSGYHVAGKTGTAYIAGQNGYKEKRYVASFVGMAPLKTPRLVVAVVVREPKKAHYGGLVAAPIFSKVMAGALRLLAITPDDLSSVKRG